MVGGPRCTGIANTVHHIQPSSQRPDLFWATENLASACAACNYSGGAYLAAGNRRTANEQIAQLKRENEYLERVVQTLEARIESLAEALVAATERPRAETKREAGATGDLLDRSGDLARCQRQDVGLACGNVRPGPTHVYCRSAFWSPCHSRSSMA